MSEDSQMKYPHEFNDKDPEDMLIDSLQTQLTTIRPIVQKFADKIINNLFWIVLILFSGCYFKEYMFPNDEPI